MLGKLIKHEFRATGRLMAPLFGALLLLAVFSRVTNQILQQVPNPTRVLYIVSVLLAIVYVLAGLGVMVFSTVLMIKRFHQNSLPTRAISCSRFPSVSTACSGRS